MCTEIGSIDITGDSEPNPDLEPHPDQFCIYRVPKSIRKGKQEAYTPQIVSIGPLHYDRPDLKGMEKRKENYVAKFFERTGKKREEVLAFIGRQEQEIRNLYSEECKLDSKKYVEMILRDAIFIIGLLMRNAGEHERDFFVKTSAEMYALQLDLLLLENQLPYFLLKDLYKLLVPSGQSFRKLCLNFFSDQMYFPENAKEKKFERKFKHFTDMQRAVLMGNFERGWSTFRHLPCATKLQESGVKFRCASEEECPLEIEFKQGELRISELSVFHETDTILRYIMALEQCCYHDSLFVCSYVQLLDFLIEDKRDAQLLVDEGIIRNWMGDSKALANLFNKLCLEIPFAENHYDKLYEQLEGHYKSPFNRNKARLKNVYFGDIWNGTATVAAVIILLLTFILLV